MGHADRALKLLLTLADERGAVELVVRGLMPTTDEERLVKWYLRNGFACDTKAIPYSYRMIRVPQSLKL